MKIELLKITTLAALSFGLTAGGRNQPQNHAYDSGTMPGEKNFEGNPARSTVDPTHPDYSDAIVEASGRRRDEWSATMKENQARLDRADESVRKEGEKTLAKMDKEVRKWDKEHEGLKRAGGADRETHVRSIAKTDHALSEHQKEFDRQVPKDAMAYKKDLNDVVSEIDQAKRDIEQRLQFLDNLRDMLQDLKSELSDLREEAEDHISSVEQSTDDDWATVKREIDSWMDENLQTS